MNKDKIVARVQDLIITEEDLDRALKTLPQQALQQFSGEQGRKNLITEMINQEVLYLDAKALGLDKTEAYMDELREIEKNLIKQHAVKVILASVKVDESEARDYYDQNPDQFAGQEKVRASHVLVKEKDEAEKLVKEIKEGLSFEEAAEKYSQCPSKAKGGDLGYFERGQMVPEFEQSAFSTAVGEISDIVKTQFGYHIIKVVDKAEGDVISYDQAKDQILNFLTQERQNLAYYSHVNELKGKYKVEVLST